MAGRFISPFFLDDVENGVSAEDVSLYDGMDIAAKCKVARPGTFLDDSLEEEAEPDVSDTISTCLKSCIDGGGEKKRALVDFVEAKAVLPEAFLDDSLEADEGDTDTKPTSSAAAVSSTCLGLGESEVERKEHTSPPEPLEVAPLVTEPPGPVVGAVNTALAENMEKLPSVQPCAKVMPVFGKKKAATNVAARTERPSKAMSKGIKRAATADSKQPGEEVEAESPDHSTGALCHSLPNSQSLNDEARADTPKLHGGKEAGTGEDSGDGNGKTSCTAGNKKAPKGDSQIKKKKEDIGQKKFEKGKQAADDKEKLKAEKKLEQERKKAEQEKRKAEREQEKVEKELRMIEREFNRLEKEEKTAKKLDAVCKPLVEDKADEKNEFLVFNVEEGSQVFENDGQNERDVVCVVGSPALEKSLKAAVVLEEAAIPGEEALSPCAQEMSPKAAVPDEAAVPGEEAHLISAPDPAGNDINPSVKPSVKKEAEGFGAKGKKQCVFGQFKPKNKQTTDGPIITSGGPSTAGKGTSGGPSTAGKGTSGGPSTAGKGTSGGPSTAGKGTSGGPSTAGKGTSGGPSAAGKGTFGGPSTAGKGTFGGPSTAGKRTSSGPSTAGKGTSGGPSTAGKGTSSGPSTAGKGTSGGPSIAPKNAGKKGKLPTGASGKEASKSQASTNKAKSSATSVANVSKKDLVVKQMGRFFGKPRKRKSDDGAAPSNKKAKMEHHSHSGPVWVQCDDCKKWRALRDCLDPCEVPDKWVCSMNEDGRYNSCASQEEEADEVAGSQEFIYSCYVPGSVVWAKMCGYPWWPAMIDEDPDEETCYEFIDDDDHPVKYHVVFLGKPVSRAWLQSDGVRPFVGDNNMNDETSIPLKYKQGLNDAFKEALGALEMTVGDRMAKLSFVKRYRSGKTRKRKQSTAVEAETTPNEPAEEKTVDEPEATVDEPEATVDEPEATVDEPDEPEAATKEADEPGSEEQSIDLSGE